MVKKSIYFRIIFSILFLHLAIENAASQIISSFPYNENFETGSPFWTASTGALTNWELGLPSYGLTSSTHSGNTCWDVNLVTPYDVSANCYLETPEFNLTGISNAKLSFWQNRNAELNFDGLHIEYSINSGATWTILGNFSDTLGRNWYNIPNSISSPTPNWSGTSQGWIQSKYILHDFNNFPLIKFRFIFTSDASSNWDGVSIDDFAITPLLSNDVEMLQLSSGINRLTAGATSSPLVFTVANSGATALTNYAISYNLNGGTAHVTNFTSTILPFDTVQLTVPGFIVPAGVFNLCASINSVGDLDHSNDTIYASGIGVNSFTVPFTDNFDGINNGWTIVNLADTLTKWELGMPNFNATNSTHSGANSWDINLYNSYLSNAYTELWSPIFNFTGIYNAKLSFWQNYNTETNFDGTRIDYSLDGGTNWSVLGIQGDTLGTNWYNQISLFSSLLPGWQGNSFSWQQSTYHLSVLDNQPNVLFKFIFTSDASVTVDGASIDDFSITPALTKDAEIVKINTTLFNLPSGTNITPLDLKVLNNGSQTISNFTVGYTINNGSPISVNYPGTLAPNASTIISLPGFTTPNGQFTISAYINLPGDLNHTNDTIFQTEKAYATVIPKSFNDFESGNQGWITENLGDPNTNWELGTPNYGITNSTHSGNQAWDINLNTTYNANALTYLFTPRYDLTGTTNPTLNFWQNRNTLSNDGFYIEYYDNNLGVWYAIPETVPGYNWYNAIGLIPGPLSASGWSGLSNGWEQSGMNINSLSITGIVQFRFVFVSNGFALGGDGVTIDDFFLNVDYQYDAGITSVICPANQVGASNNTNIIVTLKNFGTQALTNLKIAYTNNNGNIVTQNWIGNLANGASTSVSLPQVSPSIGINNLKIYVDWPSDLYHENDTLNYAYNGIATILPPFTDNLENGGNYWYVTSSSFGSTTWELGTPNFGNTNSSHSGNTCWDINLNSPYGILANTSLYSPFFNYSNALTSTLDFWINYNSEFAQDGLRLEYTSDGSIWNVLGIVNDPNGTNWYNNTIIPQNKDGWSGNSGGWKHCIYNTAVLNGLGSIRYRFVFTSDVSLTADGFSIDDFNVDETVGFNELTNGIKFTISPNPVSDVLKVQFKNLENKQYTYQICDISGRATQIQEGLQNNNNSELYIPINNLADGMYQLIIKVDGVKKAVGFVKQ